MQAKSGRTHASQHRGQYMCHSTHNLLLSTPLQRLGRTRHCASLRQNVLVFANLTDTQLGIVATEAAIKSRRNALGLLAGSTFALVATAFVNMTAAAPAWAALKDYNLDPSAPIDEFDVQLGTEGGQYAFIPNALEFTAGRITKLKLRNPSTSTHYFTAFEFAEKVFSILVLVGDPAVEVKGGIQEVALKAGASATWVFIPIKPGKYPLRCTVKGHDAMVGQIIIKRPT